MKKLSNVSTDDYRKVLAKFGATFDKINGGHERWKIKGALRPIIFQTHIEPVPVDIIKSNNKTLKITNKQFLQKLEEI